MRIAIGQLWQETNTFNPWPTTRRDFEEFGVLRGPEVIEQMARTNELGGFIQSLRSWPERPEIVGLVRLPAWPSGAATAETFDWLRQELVDALKKALPVDGVLLALHGAMVADLHPDVEGDILAALREVLGPKVPLIATLDLHANVTEKMARHASGLVLFHTVPHIDVVDTGRRGAKMLRRILIDGARPVTAFQRVPMVVPVQLANTEDPASVSYPFKQRLIELEKDPKVLTAGLATVQPWLDIPDLGAAVVVTTDGDPELAKKECSALAAQLWEKRKEYLPELVPVGEAVKQAFAAQPGLVVLSDGADGTTSGSPGDSTWLLKELIQYDWPRPAIVTLVGADVVAAAEKRGVGATLFAPLGGRLDHRFSTPVELSARIVRFFDARFVLSGHLGENMAIDMGRSALLVHKNVHIVVTARSGPHFAPELFRAAGIDPFSASVLVAKSPCGFRAAYQEKAKKIILVQAPGCAPADFWKYEYQHLTRPLWPWDEIEGWRAGPEVYSE